MKFFYNKAKKFFFLTLLFLLSCGADATKDSVPVDNQGSDTLQKVGTDTLNSALDGTPTTVYEKGMVPQEEPADDVEVGKDIERYFYALLKNLEIIEIFAGFYDNDLMTKKISIESDILPVSAIEKLTINAGSDTLIGGSDSSAFFSLSLEETQKYVSAAIVCPEIVYYDKKNKALAQPVFPYFKKEVTFKNCKESPLKSLKTGKLIFTIENVSATKVKLFLKSENFKIENRGIKLELLRKIDYANSAKITRIEAKIYLENGAKKYEFFESTLDNKIEKLGDKMFSSYRGEIIKSSPKYKKRFLLDNIIFQLIPDECTTPLSGSVSYKTAHEYAVSFDFLNATGKFEQCPVLTKITKDGKEPLDFTLGRN